MLCGDTFVTDLGPDPAPTGVNEIHITDCSCKTIEPFVDLCGKDFLVG